MSAVQEHTERKVNRLSLFIRVVVVMTASIILTVVIVFGVLFIKNQDRTNKRLLKINTADQTALAILQRATDPKLTAASQKQTLKLVACVVIDLDADLNHQVTPPPCIGVIPTASDLSKVP